jgi:hypothetical protein
MKLSYRGSTYDYTPVTVDVTEGELAGKYRGLDWKFCNQKKAPVQQATVELKYRGVALTTGDEQSANTSAPEQARRLMMDRQLKGEKRQRSMLSRLTAELKSVPVLAH